MAIYFNVKNKNSSYWSGQNKKRAIYPWIEVEASGMMYPASVMTVDGTTVRREIELFRIGVLGRAIDRHPATIKLWEESGLFSKPSVRIKVSPTKHSPIRYYSAAQILNLHTLWVFKYNARNRLFDNAEHSQMMRDFRMMMEVPFVDRLIVDPDGNIHPDKDFTKRDKT